ncbi:MAG: ATP-grasp domain-containing protein [Polyangiaceae bacterium]|nr:ATP-grasp domain-containing protein [Polyangiaceae bacterium]
MNTTLACVMGGLSIIRALGRADIPVACVLTPDAHERHALSRYVRKKLIAPGSMKNPGALLTHLLRFGASLPRPPILFFDNDDDLLFVSRHRERLSAGFRFALPSPELVEDLVDKKRFAKLAARANLPTPETHVIAQGTATHDDRMRKWTRFPCIVKPALRTHWFGSRLGDHVIGSTQKAVAVSSRAELAALAPALEAHPSDFILQPLIEGSEQRIVSYHAYVNQSGVIAEFTGRKVRTVPREYGFSSYVQITDDDRVRRLGRDIISRLGFQGVVKFDFKEDVRDGELYLLEGNPRFNLWHHPGAVAGVNLPALVYHDLVSPGTVRPVPRRVRAGVRWMWALADLQECRAAGELHTLQWLRELAAADVVEDMCLSDPLPGVARLVDRLLERVAPSGSRKEAPALGDVEA